MLPLAVSLTSAKSPPSAVIGTAESPDVAFQLFLDGPPLPLLGSFGLPCCAHIGVYGGDFTPALPIVLVTLPATAPDVASCVLPPGAAAALRARDAGASAELHIVAHGAPRLARVGGDCAHIVCRAGAPCAREREFNLMLHAWMFADDAVGDGRHAVSARADVGVWCASGVAPVAGSEGVPFGALARRPVVIHGGAFSPNNCTLRANADAAATDGAAVNAAASFVSAAYDAATRRALVTLHIVPLGEPAADALRAWLRHCDTLGDLLRGLAEHVPAAHAVAARLVAPLLAPDEARDAALQAGGEALWRDGDGADVAAGTRASAGVAAMAVQAGEAAP